MINLKIGGILVAAFMAGAFVASPELRAYAAATIGSAEIIDESILSVDIKNGQVKASDIGTDAVESVDIKNGQVASSDIATGGVMTLDISDTNGVRSVDIVNGEVKTDDIATDVVGADELIGVTKLSFTQCVLTDAEADGMVLPGGSKGVQCTGTGIDGDDSIVATINGSAQPCFGVTRAFFNGVSLTVEIRNACDGTLAPGKSGIGVIVFDK